MIELKDEDGDVLLVDDCQPDPEGPRQDGCLLHICNGGCIASVHLSPAQMKELRDVLGERLGDAVTTLADCAPAA